MCDQKSCTGSSTLTGAKPKTDQELFNAGCEMSRKHVGEPHAYSEVLWGINEVLKARGRGYDTAITLSEYWHMPLAIETPNTPVEKIIGRMDAALAGAAQHLSTAYEFSCSPQQRTLSSCRDELAHLIYKLSLKHGDLIFDLRVDSLVDSNIKAKFPKVRRGSKKYKELHAQVLDKARDAVSGGIRNEVHGRLPGVCRRLEKLAEETSQVIARVGHYESKAHDIRVLFLESTHVGDVLSEVTRIRGQLTEAVVACDTLLKQLRDIELEAKQPKEN